MRCIDVFLNTFATQYELSIRICCFWSKYFAHVKRIIYLDYIYYENMLKLSVFFFFIYLFIYFFFSDSCSGIRMPSFEQHFLYIPHHFSTSMLLLLYWSGIQVFHYSNYFQLHSICSHLKQTGPTSNPNAWCGNP